MDVDMGEIYEVVKGSVIGHYPSSKPFWKELEVRVAEKGHVWACGKAYRGVNRYFLEWLKEKSNPEVSILSEDEEKTFDIEDGMINENDFLGLSVFRIQASYFCACGGSTCVVPPPVPCATTVKNILNKYACTKNAYVTSSQPVVMLSEGTPWSTLYYPFATIDMGYIPEQNKLQYFGNIIPDVGFNYASVCLGMANWSVGGIDCCSADCPGGSEPADYRPIPVVYYPLSGSVSPAVTYRVSVNFLIT